MLAAHSLWACTGGRRPDSRFERPLVGELLRRGDDPVAVGPALRKDRHDAQPLGRQGIIAADGEEEVGGRTRRYFRLTDAGEARLAADADRLAQMERAASSAVRRLGRSALA